MSLSKRALSACIMLKTFAMVSSSFLSDIISVVVSLLVDVTVAAVVVLVVAVL